MVKMTLDATLRVAAGPTFVVGSTLDPKSYSVSQLALKNDKAPAAEKTKEVPLVPASANATLLCVRVTDENDQPGTANLTAKNGSDASSAIKISGSLIIAGQEVLASIVKNGPRVLEFTTVGDKAVVVDVVVAMD